MFDDVCNESTNIQHDPQRNFWKHACSISKKHQKTRDQRAWRWRVLLLLLLLTAAATTTPLGLDDFAQWQSHHTPSQPRLTPIFDSDVGQVGPTVFLYIHTYILLRLLRLLATTPTLTPTPAPNYSLLLLLLLLPPPPPEGRCSQDSQRQRSNSSNNSSHGNHRLFRQLTK